MSEDPGDGQIQMRILCEDLPIDERTIINFERRLLINRKLGYNFLTVAKAGDYTLRLYFTEDIQLLADYGESENSMQQRKSDQLIGELVVQPWVIHLYAGFKDHFPSCKAGDVIGLARFVEDYADTMEVGDPIELRRFATQGLILKAELVSVKRTKLKDLTPRDYAAVAKLWGFPMNLTHMGFMENAYKTPITPDTVVAFLTMRVVEPPPQNKRGWFLGKYAAKFAGKMFEYLLRRIQ